MTGMGTSKVAGRVGRGQVKFENFLAETKYYVRESYLIPRFLILWFTEYRDKTTDLMGDE
jgi:hypothetical protein